MNENWYSVNQILGVKPNAYEVSDQGRIRIIRTGLILDDYVYHSTNGFDFVLLEMQNNIVQYVAVDLIVMTSCNCIVGRFNDESLIPNHINGDTRDNRAENISPTEDIEKWSILLHDEICEDMYEVSNHGRIRKLLTGKILSANSKTCYPKVKLYTKKGVTKVYDIHRLVALCHCPRHNDTFNIVNHVDNIKFNNHWRNLEWVSHSMNNRHSASLLNKNISNDVLDKVRDLIIEGYKCDEIYHMMNCSMSKRQIKDIKTNKYYLRSNKYTLSDLEKVWSAEYKEHAFFTESDIEHICESLVHNDMDILKTHDQLTKEGYCLSRAAIYDIKKKRHHKQISDKYF